MPRPGLYPCPLAIRIDLKKPQLPFRVQDEIQRSEAQAQATRHSYAFPGDLGRKDVNGVRQVRRRSLAPVHLRFRVALGVSSYGKHPIPNNRGAHVISFLDFPLKYQWADPDGERVGLRIDVDAGGEDDPVGTLPLHDSVSQRFADNPSFRGKRLYSNRRIADQRLGYQKPEPPGNS